MSGIGEQPYALNYSPGLRWLLVLAGLGQRRVQISLTPERLEVHTLYFRVTVPIADIAAVGDGSASWLALAGVHTDARGHWVINGSPGPVVTVDVDPPARAHAMGLQVTVRRLALGLADASAFHTEIDALRQKGS